TNKGLDSHDINKGFINKELTSKSNKDTNKDTNKDNKGLINKELTSNYNKDINGFINKELTSNDINNQSCKLSPFSIKVRFYKAIVVEEGVNYSNIDNVCYLLIKEVNSSNKKEWVWVVNKGVIDKVYVSSIKGCYYSVVEGVIVFRSSSDKRVGCYSSSRDKRFLVETSGSHDKNLPLSTIPTLRKQMVSINDRECIIEKTLEGYSMSAISSNYRINYQTAKSIVRRYLKTGLEFVEKRGGDRRSKLTLEIKESLQTYGNFEQWVKCTFYVDVSTSTIDRALREFHYTLKRVTLVPERRNTLSTIELRTNYATSFRELEVDNDDKNFVFLDEVGFAVIIRPIRGRNIRSESAYLSVTAARSRNISEVSAMNKYGMIYHKIHERVINDEDFKLFFKDIHLSLMDNARIHHYQGLNDDEEIASYRIKYLPLYSPFLNPIENIFSSQLRILIYEKFNEITGEHCSSFYHKMLGYLQMAEVGQVILE
ncbi:DDE-like endonuclease, partial [Hamiltosporidium tvaerminnensis]